MWQTLVFNRQMNRFAKEQRKLAKRWRKEAKLIKASGEGSQSVDIGSDIENRVQEIDLQIALLRTNYLCSTARRLFIPVPKIDFSEGWTKAGDGSKEAHMTDAALSVLKKTIDTEQKERAERVTRWLGGLTGLVGTLTGLAALLLHGSK